MSSEGIVPASNSIRRGVVKQVLSGDAVVILGGPRSNGPPEEITVYLSNVSAPRIAKRPTDTAPGTQDEPWAWHSREYLRKRLVGETVNFVKDFTAASNRDHGRIYLGGTSMATAENMNESAVAAGWLEVRQGKVVDEQTQKLLDLQEQAKANKLGKWNDDLSGSVRDIKWNIHDARSLVDHYKQQKVEAVIEQVRDGTTVRAFLLPNYEYITLQLSGVRSPSSRAGNDGRVEAYAEEAKFFVESRLLQRDIHIVLESVSNNNFVGSIVHPKGNIAESLLREGLAKCVDWSIGLCTGGAEKLRAAENVAKERKLRMWRGYTPSSGVLAEKKKFEAKVVEVILNDALMVLTDDGEETKVFLSSVRLPRPEGGPVARGDKKQFRPLYEIPFMFECREFLRKRLVGRRVQITVDYIQPKAEQFPEKTCCTIEVGGKNIALALLEAGLSKVVRHRNDDENRSSQYDALLAAEAKAEKDKKGLFGETDGHTVRVSELMNELQRSKQYLPQLQRGAHRPEAVVEYITSGSRLRVYVPKDNILITFLLSGINCPKSARLGINGQQAAPAEAYADDAAKFTRRNVMQKEVELEIESLDKQGAFIGYLWVKTEDGSKQNLSELLLEQGLSTLHFTAEKSSHYNHLLAAETRAKNAKRNMWSTWTDTDAVAQEEEAANQKAERTVAFKRVAVSDVGRTGPSFKFAAQSIEDGLRIETLMRDLRTGVSAPTPGTYTPKRGELVAAKFSQDKQWYRARVEAIRKDRADILYIDYGNRESTDITNLAPLPVGIGSVPPGAKEYVLALATVPTDEEYASASFKALEQLFYSAPSLDINVEYGGNAVQAVVEINGSRVDVGKALIEDGFALAEKRREQRLQKLVTEYVEAEKEAKKERRNIWEFGDFTGNEL